MILLRLIVSIFSPPIAIAISRGSKRAAYINLTVWSVAIITFFGISFAISIAIYIATLIHAVILITHTSSSRNLTPAGGNKKDYIFLVLSSTALVFSGIVFLQTVNDTSNIKIDEHAVANGKRLFKSCAGCHGLTRKNYIGPHLVNVLGRPVGSLANYSYSDSFRSKNFLWTDNMLMKFLKGPRDFIPGTKMAITPLSEKDALDIIEYLKTI
jgi:cytochrome c